MSFSSKPQKVKPKGSVKELKLVQTVNRRGRDTIKTEEVKTPKHCRQPSPSKTRGNRSPSPTKRLRVDGFDIDPIPFDLEEPEKSTKRQTLVFLFLLWPMQFSHYSKGQNDYLEQFLDHEARYSRHILNLELPPLNLTCHSCPAEGRYRCLDCYGALWFCRGCLLRAHRQHPFHRPQEFKEGSFEKMSLSDLGYVFILGHSLASGCCPDEENFFADRRVVLIHINGIFEHFVRFCKCLGSLPEHEQLFNHRLFPSTFDRPETAFTLDVLDYFGIDAMECKTSAQSFFQKLRRVTNNAFPGEVPVSLPFHSIIPKCT